MARKRQKEKSPTRTGEQGHKRTDSTRQKLIEAGLELFSLHGYDGTSTRMLAEWSEANVAAIPYYFGGKQGLYRAVVEYITEILYENVSDCAEQVTAFLRSKSDNRQEAFNLILGLLGRLARLAVGSEMGGKIGPIMIREQMNPTTAHEIINDNFTNRIHRELTALVAIVTHMDPESSDTIILAHTLIGQVIIFRASRTTVLRRLGWKTVGPDELRQIKRMVFSGIQRQLAAEDLTIPEEVLS